MFKKGEKEGRGEEKRDDNMQRLPNFLLFKKIWEFGKSRPYIPFDSMDILLSLSALLSLRDCEAGPVWWWWWWTWP